MQTLATPGLRRERHAPHRSGRPSTTRLSTPVLVEIAPPKSIKPALRRPAPFTALGARLSVDDRVAHLSITAPPPIAWDVASRNAFVEQLTQLASRPDVDAVMLDGDRLFQEQSGDQASSDPTFRDILTAVSASPAPVIAVIRGDAIGAGLELALACSARVCDFATSFALPAVARGQIPVNGAAYRLPRLIGVEAAGDMLIFGERVDARRALQLGLVNELDPACASAFARTWLKKADRATRTDAEALAAALYGLRLKVRRAAPDQVAPMAALRSMEAGVDLPERRALAASITIAEELSNTNQADALAYVEAGAVALRRTLDVGDLQPDDVTWRLQWPMAREAIHLLDEGASPAQIDRCLAQYGFCEGIFTRSDRIGLDKVFGDRAAGSTPQMSWRIYSPTLDLMIDAGRCGGPAAAGWYRPTDNHCRFDPDVDHLLQSSAMFQRIRRGPLTDDLVMRRCLYAAINAAEGVRRQYPRLTKAQIDAVWVTRLEFPNWKGGPLYQAEQIGTSKIVAQLDVWRSARDTFGEVAFSAGA